MHDPSPSTTARFAATALASLTLVACTARDEPKTPFSLTSEASTSSENTTLKGHTSADRLATSPSTLERAKVAGITPVHPNTGEFGPFDGPQKTLVYVNTDAKIMYYSPEHHSAVFGTQNPGSLLFEVSPLGAFDIRGGQRRPVEASGTLSSWPKANDVVAAIAAESIRLEREREAKAAEGAFPGEPLSRYELGRALSAGSIWGTSEDE